MNKDDLKAKAENLKERAKEAAESLGKRRASDDSGPSVSSDRGSSTQAGKSAAGESAGSRRAERENKAIEPEDVEGAESDVDPEIEESEDE